MLVSINRRKKNEKEEDKKKTKVENHVVKYSQQISDFQQQQKTMHQRDVNSSTTNTKTHIKGKRQIHKNDMIKFPASLYN